MAFTEDLSPFFDTDEFAVEALYKGASTVRVIFDNAYGDDFEVAGLVPQCTARAIDFSAIARGDSLVIDSKSYKVVTWRGDGTGVLNILLESA